MEILVWLLSKYVTSYCSLTSWDWRWKGYFSAIRETLIEMLMTVTHLLWPQSFAFEDEEANKNIYLKLFPLTSSSESTAAYHLIIIIPSANWGKGWLINWKKMWEYGFKSNCCSEKKSMDWFYCLSSTMTVSLRIMHLSHCPTLPIFTLKKKIWYHLSSWGNIWDSTANRRCSSQLVLTQLQEKWLRIHWLKRTTLMKLLSPGDQHVGRYTAERFQFSHHWPEWLCKVCISAIYNGCWLWNSQPLTLLSLMLWTYRVHVVITLLYCNKI